MQTHPNNPYPIVGESRDKALAWAEGFEAGKQAQLAATPCSCHTCKTVRELEAYKKLTEEKRGQPHVCRPGCFK